MEEDSTFVPSRSVGLSCQRGTLEGSRAIGMEHSCHRTQQLMDHRRTLNSKPQSSWHRHSLGIGCYHVSDKECVDLRKV